MKSMFKRIFSAILVVALAAGIGFVMPADAEAASMTYDKKVTVYLMNKTGKSSGYKYADIYVNNPKKEIKVSSLKSSKSSVVTVTGVDNYDGFSCIELKAKKEGTATVSFKVGSTTYKTKVTVKNYTNPVKTLKISGVNDGKNIASKVKNSYWSHTLKLKKTTKKAKLKVQAKSGWKLTSVYVYDYNSKNLVDKYYYDGTTKLKSYSLGTLKKNKLYSIYLSFTNKKNGETIDVDYDINW